MLFSIIIPVYKVEKFLRECLDSVIGQTFQEWEAVCINDGSTDGSATVLEEYAAKDRRFRVINQPNGGLSAARNAGMKAVKGEHVLFLDEFRERAQLRAERFIVHNIILQFAMKPS